MSRLFQAIAVILALALPGGAAAEICAGDYEILETADGACTVTKYLGSESDVVIPKTIDGLTVMAIGKEAFSGSKIASIQFPESIVSIGENAFHFCANLTELILPEGLQSIGLSAFSDCGNLQSVSMPDSVTDMGRKVFIRCKSLEKIRFSAGLDAIADGAFRGCYRLREAHLPDGIREIGAYAFFGCRSLASVHLPEGLEQIEYRAFDECDQLESLMLPESLKWLGPQALDMEGNLTAHVVSGSAAERLATGNVPHVVADLKPGGAARESTHDDIGGSELFSGLEDIAQDGRKTLLDESAAFARKTEKRTTLAQTPEPEETAQTQTEQPSAAPTASALPAEAPLPSPDATEDDESREWTGRAIGATGGTVEATVSVARGIIERCAIEDETQTEEMEAGYGLACSYVTGRAAQEIEGLAKKDFMRRIRAYSEEAGCKLSAGGEDADAALTAFLAIKDALA